MKKSIISAAIAAAFVAPFAAAADEVTLYGQVNIVLNQNGGNNSYESNLVANETDTSSRWGIKGSEDLGGGLTGLFQMERGVSVLGVDKSAVRHFYVGLGTSAGKFLLGQTWSSYHSNLGFAITVNHTDTLSGYGTGYPYIGTATTATGTGDVTKFNGSARPPASVVWQSPNWNGLTLGANYGDLNNYAAATSTVKPSTTGLGAKWTNGSVTAGLGYSQSVSSTAATGNAAVAGAGTDKVTQTQTGLGLRYDASSFAVALRYEFSESKYSGSATPATNVKLESQRAIVYARYNINSANQLNFKYASVEDTKVDGTKIKDTGATNTILEYNYSLSKRTTFIAGYEAVDSKASTGQDLNRLSVGFGHSF